MRIWIDTALNPFNLPEPSEWWQTIVYDYDKMLRILPGQKDRVYRLGRLARREARLGLQTMKDVHQHPDTVAMINAGLVPITTVMPWAIHSNKILRDLKARDTWAHHGGNPNKIVDDMEAAEAAEADRADAAAKEHLDTRSAFAFRHMQYLKGERLMVGEANRGRQGKTASTDKTRVKVAMPGSITVSSSKDSRAPGVPSGKTIATNRGIVLTDAR